MTAEYTRDKGWRWAGWKSKQNIDRLLRVILVKYMCEYLFIGLKKGRIVDTATTATTIMYEMISNCLY